MAVTFPVTRLGVKIELALGADRTQLPATWAWTDITNYWRPNSLIKATVGRQDEGSTVDPGTCSFVLDNSDGRFCRTNPNGAYWGVLNRGTPVKISIDYGDGFQQWFLGEVPSWAPRWDISQRDKYVSITAAGGLRRLGQTRAPLRSPLYRYNTTYYTQNSTYWSMEDKEGSTAAQADLGDGGPMTPTTVSQFTTSTGKRLPAPGAPAMGTSEGEPPGSEKIVNLTKGGTLFGKIPQSASDPQQWSVDWVMRFNVKPTGYTTFNNTIFRWNCAISGTYDQWSIIVNGSTVELLAEYSVSGSGGFIMPINLNVWDGTAHHFRVVCKMDTATDISVNIRVDDNLLGSYILPSSQLSQLQSFFINSNELTGDLMPTAFGHLMAAPGIVYFDGDYGSVGAAFGYVGELANLRINRILIEENIEREVFSGDASSMGPQGIGTVMELLRECEAADGGVLYEYQTGLGYQNRSFRYNRTGSMSLAFTDLSDPPEPADDDQNLRNKVTVKRPDGQEQAWQNDASITASGIADKGFTLNLEDDYQALARAQWEVWLGTQDALRWPSVSLDLAARPTKITSWITTNVGDRIVISGPPAEIGPATVSLFVEGYTETIGWYDWKVELNCSNADPYTVAKLENAILGKADTEGSAIATAANTTATSLSVKTLTGPLWTTSGGQFPFDIVAGTGEKMTVTNITGGISPQTFTVTRSINGVVKSLPVDTDIRLANPMVLAI